MRASERASDFVSAGRHDDKFRFGLAKGGVASTRVGERQLVGLLLSSSSSFVILTKAMIRAFGARMCRGEADERKEERWMDGRREIYTEVSEREREVS